MTIINPNSISGITSVTAEAGVINFYKSDGTLAGLQLNGVNFNTTSGISTFNNVYVGGTITYEDVKNVDSVGIVTARAGIKVPDDQRILLGAANDLDIYHTTSGTSWIRHGNTSEYFVIEGDQMDFRSYTNSHYRVRMGTAVELRHNNTERLKTSSTGVTITGDITTSDKIIHAGDTDTAIRFPADDTVSVETAGQQNVQVDGTRVLLKSPSGTNTTVRLQHQGNSGYGDIILDRTVNAFIIDNDPGNAGSNGTYFSVKTIGSERLRITSAGDVGINEASPQYQLHIHDDTTYHGIFVNGNAAPRIAFARDTTTTGEWSVGVDGTNGAQFAINNSNDNSNRKVIISSSQISLISNTSVVGDLDITDKIFHHGDVDTAIRFPSADTITAETGGSERLRIASTGNVTINNDLDVDGHTNLDNVSIAGVTTCAGLLEVTASGDCIKLAANRRLVLGQSWLYGSIYNTGSNLTFNALNQYTFACWDGNSMENWMTVSGVNGRVSIGGGTMGNNGTKQPLINVTGHTTQSITMSSSDGSNLTERFKLTDSGITMASTVGIQTNDVTRANLANPVGAGNSLVGMYIGDGSLLFNNTLNRVGGYYISTETNALNAGPVTLDANMKIDGAWVIV